MLPCRSDLLLRAGGILAVVLLAAVLGAPSAGAQDRPAIEFLPDSLMEEAAETIERGEEYRIQVEDRDNDRTIEISIGGSRDHSNGVVRFGEDIFINEDEFIDGDVVAMGGSVTNLGRIAGDCVAMGGDVTIGEDAVVDGDAVCMGGRLTIKDGAEISRDAVSIWGSLDIAPTARVRGDEVEVGGFGTISMDGWPNFGWDDRSPVNALWKLFQHFIWLVILTGLGILLYNVFPSRMERVSDTVRHDGLRAFLAGLAGEVLLIPLMLALLITIVGIPVILILIFLTPLALLVGYIAVAEAAGGRAGVRFFGGVGLNRAIFVGLFALEGLLLLGRLFRILGPVFQVPASVFTLIGVLVIWIAMTIGFGAVIMTRFRAKERPAAVAPPPSPDAGTATPSLGPRPGEAPGS